MKIVTNIAISGRPMPMAGASAGYAPDYDGNKQSDLVMFGMNES